MRDLIDDLERWRAASRRVALARVVHLEGSGPRGPGAAMAVDDRGEVIGSVSGGCVEGALVHEASALLRAERSPGRIAFGVSDDDAFEVGLTCGGTIHLFLETLDGCSSLLDALAADVRAGRPAALITVIATAHDRVPIGTRMLVRTGAPPLGTLGAGSLDRVVARDAAAALAAGRTTLRRYGADGEATPEALGDEAGVEVFVESFAPPPQMWIFGAVDFTAALARQAKLLGYRVVVCDARATFATRQRFAMADDLVVGWPDALFARHGASLTPRDAVCVLTHDAKFDVPAIEGALATEVGYIGVMGSRRTHARRLARLAEAGVTDPAALARLHAPIGLDLGAATPEETAVSIVAEIIALRAGRAGRPLRETLGAIHGRGGG
jgi:xanthine dehydrogenase accessory factor